LCQCFLASLHYGKNGNFIHPLSKDQKCENKKPSTPADEGDQRLSKDYNFVEESNENEE